jgi:hypothetical protein
MKAFCTVLSLLMASLSCGSDVSIYKLEHSVDEVVRV